MEETLKKKSGEININTSLESVGLPDTFHEIWSRITRPMQDSKTGISIEVIDGFEDVLGAPLGSGTFYNHGNTIFQLIFSLSATAHPAIREVMRNVQLASSGDIVKALRDKQVLLGIKILDLGSGRWPGFALAAKALGAQVYTADIQDLKADFKSILDGHLQVDLNDQNTISALQKSTGGSFDIITENILAGVPHERKIAKTPPARAVREMGKALLKPGGLMFCLSQVGQVDKVLRRRKTYSPEELQATCAEIEQLINRLLKAENDGNPLDLKSIAVLMTKRDFFEVAYRLGDEQQKRTIANYIHRLISLGERRNATSQEQHALQELRSLGQGMTKDLLEIFEKDIRDIPQLRRILLGDLRFMIMRAEDKYKALVIAALIRLSDILEVVASGDIKNGITARGCLDTILTYGTTEHQQKVMPTIEKILHNVSQTETFPFFIALCFNQKADLSSIGINFLQPFFVRRGLPADSLKWWLGSGKIDDIEYIVQESTKRILDIEKAEPGGAKFLYDNFGVICFARYPIDLLIKQIRNYDDVTTPYGVLLYLRDDHNGAIYHRSDIVLGSLLHETELLMNLRILEGEGSPDITRRLLTLHKKYAQAASGRKISLGVVDAHGTERNIEGLFSIEDLNGPRMRRIGNLLEDHATIIFNSCSTGAKGGVAQKLSSALHKRRIVAPEVDTAVTHYVVTKDENGNLLFSAKYHRGKTMTYSEGKLEE